MNRSAIREQAFKLIYSLDIQKNENLEEQIELYIENNKITEKRAKEYIKESVKGIEKNKQNILELIEKHMEHLEPLESGIILQAQERYLDLVNLIYIIKDLQERLIILVHI